jgi:nitroimidazol reductase NimA-like FMN-containing flavoprotein (pyridoxamine 5'-phosphate oxidase superfamily)
MHPAEDLSRTECARLLTAGVAGRVALTAPTGPHIVPVNYSTRGEAILVRTATNSRLAVYGRGAVVCFQTDVYDREQQHGWSVVVRGRAEGVHDAQELDEIARHWPPQPWAPGPRHLVLRIPWTEVTGRQVGGGWDPWLYLPRPERLRDDPPSWPDDR